MLGLYHADNLAGSWIPHTANPVLIDAALSRPAGAFIRRNGCTLRPVQDCSRGYGGAVTLCQLDALGESEFAQTPVGRIRSGPFGCHTYNRRSGLEVIDVFGHVRSLQEVATSYEPIPREPPSSGPQALLADPASASVTSSCQLVEPAVAREERARSTFLAQ
jgi:hypothetical protein